MSTQPSRLAVEPADDGALIITGVIDSHTADSLLEQLQRRGHDADVVIDLSAVEFIDSSGLRVLVSTHQALDDAGHKLVLRGMSNAVERLLEITGLHEHLHTG